MSDLIDRDALEAKIRENSMRIRFFDPSVNVILHLIRYAPSVNHWIPCSERLPDNGVAVLVYTGENNFKVWLAEYSKYMEVWTLAGNYIPIKKNAVTHWMPLPSTEGLT